MRIIIAIFGLILLTSCTSIKQVHTGNVPVCERTEMKMYSAGQMHGVSIQYINQEIRNYHGSDLAEYIDQCHIGLNATRRNFTGVIDDMKTCGFVLKSQNTSTSPNTVVEQYNHPNGGYVELYNRTVNGQTRICPFETGRWK